MHEGELKDSQNRDMINSWLDVPQFRTLGDGARFAYNIRGPNKMVNADSVKLRTLLGYVGGNTFWKSVPKKLFERIKYWTIVSIEKIKRIEDDASDEVEPDNYKIDVCFLCLEALAQ